MASTMPIGSGRSASGDRDSGTTNHAAASAASPTGMLTRKIGRQPQPARFHCTSTPPRTKPATDAEPSTPPQTPNTFPRSCGGKVTWMIARICGTIRPAIAPSKNRAAISMAGLTATPHSADPTVKPATPSRKMRLRPKMSPSRPPVINSAANPSTYPDTTHSNCAYVACRSFRMLGAATFTIVASSRSITPATKMTTKAAHRRGSSAGGAVPFAPAWARPGSRVRLCVSSVMASLPVAHRSSGTGVAGPGPASPGAPGRSCLITAKTERGQRSCLRTTTSGRPGDSSSRGPWLAGGGSVPGVAEVGALDPDRDDRDDQGEQHDRGGDQVGAGKAGRQGVVVGGGERRAAGLRGGAGVGGRGLGVGGLGVDAVGDHGPGDGAEQGEPDRAADLLAGVAQAGGDPGLAVGDPGHGDQGDRHEQQAQAGREDQHRAQHPAGVAAVLGQPRQPVQAGGGDRGTGQQQRPGADARDELGGGAGGHQDPGHQRQVGDAGFERRVPPGGLHEHRQEEEHAEDGGADAQHDQVRAGPVAVGQQAHRQLAIEPGVDLRELQARILGQDPALDSVARRAGARAETVPPIWYARTTYGIHIAYLVAGEGERDIVFVPGLMSHLELFWEDPQTAGFFRQLATLGRLIMFDKRDTGLSDRGSGDMTLEERMEDLRAVMGAAGSSRAVLFGYSEGAPMSLLFAATHPGQVTALILGSASAQWFPVPGYPCRQGAQEMFDALTGIAAHRWGQGASIE